MAAFRIHMDNGEVVTVMHGQFATVDDIHVMLEAGMMPFATTHVWGVISDSSDAAAKVSLSTISLKALPLPTAAAKEICVHRDRVSLVERIA